MRMPSAILVSAVMLGAATTGQAPPSMDIYFGNRPAEYKVAVWGPESVPSPAYAFTAAKILPVTGEPIHNGVILTLDSKIIAIGSADEIDIPENYEVIDVGRHWIVPGLVDLHSHVPSILNDSVHASNPEMRTLDQITLEHDSLKKSLAGGISRGVRCAHRIPPVSVRSSVLVRSTTRPPASPCSARSRSGPAPS